MYDFVRGPLVWLGFATFIAGSVVTLATRLRLARKDKVVYPYMSARFGLRSVLHWVVPFANRNTRLHPLLTVVSFAFHVCLLAVPVLAVGHAVLWRASWGVSWWSLPDGLADAMTLMVVLGGLALLVRRLIAPEVRNVTTGWDVLVILVVVAPFATGYVAHQQWLPYQATLTLHILTGVLWLAVIPFTRLSHMLWFLLTRSYLGSELGGTRAARDW